MIKDVASCLTILAFFFFFGPSEVISASCNISYNQDVLVKSSALRNHQGKTWNRCPIRKGWRLIPRVCVLEYYSTRAPAISFLLASYTYLPIRIVKAVRFLASGQQAMNYLGYLVSFPGIQSMARIFAKLIFYESLQSYKDAPKSRARAYCY